MKQRPLRLYLIYQEKTEGFSVKNKQEVVPIQFVEKKTTTSNQKQRTSAKLALRLKQPSGQEIHICNGINQYILQAVLKELG